MNKHFQSNLHKKSIEAEQLYNRPSVYEILTKHSLESQVKKEIANRNVLKAMFTVALYMVKHRLPNDSFEDMMKLLANAGSKEMKQYLSECPKNATHLSFKSYKKLLVVMNSFIEKPMLDAAKGQWFTIFIDEKTAVRQQSTRNIRPWSRTR